MKIRKFEGRTEKEVIEAIKDELGADALVLSIKKIQPKGIFSFFRKPVVEVTAAYEEKIAAKKVKAHVNDSEAARLRDDLEFKQSQNGFERIMSEKTISEQKERIKELEGKLYSVEDLLDKAVANLSISYHKLENNQRRYNNNLIQIFYDALTKQGVLPEVAEDMLDELDLIEENSELDITFIIKLVYNKIINILGEPQTINSDELKKGSPKIIAFIGPTGVGKTTTIAKLSADFILKKGLNVGLITADTYRIAAVEQLKTYAEILGIEVSVVYNKDDLSEYVGAMADSDDIILIDTAGRSHKNDSNLKELAELLDVVPNCEKFLVLSLTTKYEDILNIVNTYSRITDFKIIFTKLDETLQYGSILNICKVTGKTISYVTMGQAVPDDIDSIRPEKIAKALLGLGEED